MIPLIVIFVSIAAGLAWGVHSVHAANKRNNLERLRREFEMAVNSYRDDLKN